MSALLQDRAALCVCGFDHLCACGCGEELNPNLRRVHELLASGANHRQAAEIIGVCREQVSILVRKPPRYVKGHIHRDVRDAAVTAWVQRNAIERVRREEAHDARILKAAVAQIERGDTRFLAYPFAGSKIVQKHRPDLYAAWRTGYKSQAEKDAERWAARQAAFETRRIQNVRTAADAHVRRATRELVRFKAWHEKQRLQAERAAERERVRAERLAEKQRLQAERAAERERVRAMKSARWWREKPEKKLPISFDALEVWDNGTGSELYERVITSRTDDPADLLLQDADATSLRQIVGDMTPEDVQRMTTWDLDRLRARLADAGLVPDGVQDAERERLQHPTRHTGEHVVEAHGHGSRKKRREKVAHKQANRNRGNSNRPAQKPHKRWDRDSDFVTWSAE